MKRIVICLFYLWPLSSYIIVKIHKHINEFFGTDIKVWGRENSLRISKENTDIFIHIGKIGILEISNIRNKRN